MQIDAIFKPKKRSKKSKDEEVLDRAADEEVSRMRESMLAAAASDVQANQDKLPATSKLRLLPQVMEILRKYAKRIILYLNSPLISSVDLRTLNQSQTTTY
jgi:transcription factor SPN1